MKSKLINISDFEPEQQINSIDSKIVASLERISQAFRVLLWQESKEFTLSPIQIQVLIFLLHHSPEKRKVSYLADEFNLTKATISDSVKILEEKRFITKEYDAIDSRSYMIHLTKKGKDIAAKAGFFTKEIRQPIINLNQDNKENLLLSLLGVISHLNQAGVITVQRMCKSCAYYRPSANGQTHFCNLLNQPLRDIDLRIDCPEHQLKI